MTRWKGVLLAGVSALALSAGPASAAPLTAFIGGFLNALGAGTWLASGAVGAWTAGFGAGSFLGGSLVGRMIVSLGVNALAASLYRPKLPPPQQQLVNLSQPLSPMQRVYGRVRKGGPVIFTGYKTNARHYAVAIAAHRTKGPVAHWLETYEVTLDGSGQITSDPLTGCGSIRAYRGLPGQTVDALLDSTFAEVTSAYDFAGISYAAIDARAVAASAVSTVYPTGREWSYAPVWDGWDEVYDPRIDDTDWTNNAALILAHEALFHGKTVDWDEVAVEADFCDALVVNGDGGTQRRWTLNVALDDTITWEQARDEMGRACDAFFFETVDGKVGFRVGRYITPTVALTERDFVAVNVADKSWGPDVPGEAVVKYTEPGYDYQQATTGTIAEEAGLPRLEDELWAIDSHNQACRIAKRQIRRARSDWTLQGTVKLIGYEMIGQRFVRVQLDEVGLDEVFEIEKLIRNGDGITFSVEARSVTEDDFAFDALTEEPARPARGDVASDATVAAITGLTGEAVTGTGGIAQIEWSWPAQAASLTQVLRFRVSGATDWQEIAAGEGQSLILLSGLIDGESYEAQVRNRTAAGRVSEWSSTVTVDAIANTTPPGALAAFAVTVSGGTTGAVTLTAPNDPNYAAARIWRGPTTTFGDASLVRTEYGAPGLADAWDDTGLAAGTYYYWAAATNGSGIEGTRSGPQSITII